LDLEEYFGRRAPFFAFDGGDGGDDVNHNHLGLGRGRHHWRREGGVGTMAAATTMEARQ
jgi:hypothetical protein